MLIPSHFSKLHQSLHLFRTNELPLLLCELKQNGFIPAACCDDYILWQCFIDQLLENEIQVLKGGAESMSGNKSRTLTRVEQNAIRYTAGSVIQKLENKCRHDCVMKECLWGMLQEEHDYNQDSSEQWLEATDRGGLYYITDTAFDLFVEIEVFVYLQLSQSQQQNLDQLQKSACGDPDILTAWSECIINIDNTPKKRNCCKRL